MRLAVIDFSSVAISLLVADTGGEKNYRPVAGLRRSVPILDYLTHDGNLSETGIRKCKEEVRYLSEAARNAGSDEIHLIATASMRIIRNRDEVSREISEEAGCDVVLLSGRDEAYADYMANREFSILSPALLLDIGGVSAEFADLSDSKKKHMFSLPIGPVMLMTMFDSLYPDVDENLSQLGISLISQAVLQLIFNMAFPPVPSNVKLVLSMSTAASTLGCLILTIAMWVLFSDWMVMLTLRFAIVVLGVISIVISPSPSPCVGDAVATSVWLIVTFHLQFELMCTISCPPSGDISIVSVLTVRYSSVVSSSLQAKMARSAIP